MSKINKVMARAWSMLGQRGTFFGIALPALAKENENLVVMTADLLVLSGLEKFKSQFPDQVIDVGIAEQNMIGIATGLASEGYSVYATTYSNFIAMRSYEQVRLDCGYMRFPLKIVGSGSGLVMGMSGNTHYGIEDISLMRSIPNMTVICPCDGIETYKVAMAVEQYNKPVYVRLTGGLNIPAVYTDDFDFQIGKINEVRAGEDMTILAHGTMVHTALKVAAMFDAEGISVRVADAHTIKPLDEDYLIRCKSSKLVVTLEEHSVLGGLGSAVSEVISQNNLNCRLVPIGINDIFPHPGSYDFMLKTCGLDCDSVYRRIKEELAK